MYQISLQDINYFHSSHKKKYILVPLVPCKQISIARCTHIIYLWSSYTLSAPELIHIDTYSHPTDLGTHLDTTSEDRREEVEV